MWHPADNGVPPVQRPSSSDPRAPLPDRDTQKDLLQQHHHHHHHHRIEEERFRGIRDQEHSGYLTNGAIPEPDATLQPHFHHSTQEMQRNLAQRPSGQELSKNVSSDSSSHDNHSPTKTSVTMKLPVSSSSFDSIHIDTRTSYPRRRSSTSTSTNLTAAVSRPESQSYIARISIPRSHRARFAEALSNPPDPVLRIMKKSVRFTNPSLDTAESASSSTSARREQNSPVAYSTIKYKTLPSRSSSQQGSASSSSSTVPRALYSHPTIPINSKVFAMPIPAIDKDPEEKMAELMELKRMKIRQEDFLRVKDEIFQTSQSLEEKESILSEVRSERKSLQSELVRYIAMVKQIQRDFELAQQAETELLKDRDQLSQHLTQLKHYDFKALKDEVDQLREKRGLDPLPSLEQEEAEHMSRYLEQRRGQWREDGVQDSMLGNEGSHSGGAGVGRSGNPSDRGPSPSSHSSTGYPSSSNATSASGSGSTPLRTSTSMPKITSASSSTSSRGKDKANDERPGRSGKSSSHSSSRSSSVSANGKARQVSPSTGERRGRGRPRKPETASRSAMRDDSQSPRPSSRASSSATSREERIKKRSRY